MKHCNTHSRNTQIETMNTVMAQRRVRRCSTKERQLGLNPEGGAESVLPEEHMFLPLPSVHRQIIPPTPVPQEVTAMVFTSPVWPRFLNTL